MLYSNNKAVRVHVESTIDATGRRTHYYASRSIEVIALETRYSTASPPHKQFKTLGPADTRKKRSVESTRPMQNAAIYRITGDDVESTPFRTETYTQGLGRQAGSSHHRLTLENGTRSQTFGIHVYVRLVHHSTEPVSYIPSLYFLVNSCQEPVLMPHSFRDHFPQMKLTINARSIKFSPCNKEKQGIIMQQSALKKLHPVETYESQHRSPFLAHPRTNILLETRPDYDKNLSKFIVTKRLTKDQHEENQNCIQIRRLTYLSLAKMKKQRLHSNNMDKNCIESKPLTKKTLHPKILGLYAPN
uniref:Uncharacterized protein n=1 Tax=Romanomermis culicivorax TaxID=13658 RepID=A0A915HPR0_ROMCU